MLLSSSVVPLLSALACSAHVRASPAAGGATLSQRQTSSTLTPEQQFAMNIGINMAAQQGEIDAVEAIQKMQQAGISDPDVFNATKGTLMTLVGASSQVRMNSQKLLPSGSAAVTSLAKLEESQVLGYITANNLTGDPSVDAPNLDSLLSRLQGDLQLNMRLQAEATAGEQGTPTATASAMPSMMTK